MSRKTDAQKRENMRKSWHEKEMSKEPDVNWRRCEKKELTRERDVTRKSADEKDLAKKAMSKSKRFQQKGKSCDRDVKKLFFRTQAVWHTTDTYFRFAPAFRGNFRPGLPGLPSSCFQPIPTPSFLLTNHLFAERLEDGPVLRCRKVLGTLYELLRASKSWVPKSPSWYSGTRPKYVSKMGKYNGLIWFNHQKMGVIMGQWWNGFFSLTNNTFFGSENKGPHQLAT
jgi:hypothetical protein